MIFIFDTDDYMKLDTPVLHHNQVTIWNIFICLRTVLYQIQIQRYTKRLRKIYGLYRDGAIKKSKSQKFYASA